MKRFPRRFATTHTVLYHCLCHYLYRDLARYVLSLVARRVFATETDELRAQAVARVRECSPPHCPPLHLCVEHCSSRVYEHSRLMSFSGTFIRRGQFTRVWTRSWGETVDDYRARMAKRWDREKWARKK